MPEARAAGADSATFGHSDRYSGSGRKPVLTCSAQATPRGVRQHGYISAAVPGHPPHPLVINLRGRPDVVAKVANARESAALASPLMALAAPDFPPHVSRVRLRLTYRPPPLDRMPGGTHQTSASACDVGGGWSCMRHLEAGGARDRTQRETVLVQGHRKRTIQNLTYNPRSRACEPHQI